MSFPAGNSNVSVSQGLWPLILNMEGQDRFDQRISSAASMYRYPVPSRHLSAQKGGLKCIRVTLANEQKDSWFDLVRDPGEQQPLAAAPEGEHARAIVDTLEQLARELEENTDGWSDELQDQLRAIGYLQ